MFAFLCGLPWFGRRIKLWREQQPTRTYSYYLDCKFSCSILILVMRRTAPFTASSLLTVVIPAAKRTASASYVLKKKRIQEYKK